MEKPDAVMLFFGANDSVIGRAREHRKNAGSPMTLHLTRDGVHLSERGSILAAETMLRAWKMKM